MIVRLVALALLSLSSVLALAQTPPQPPDAGTILQQTREPFRLPPPAPDLVPRAPTPKPALGAQPKLRVKVAAFTFSGNTLLPEDELREKVQEFVGKELNFEGLNDAATEVRAYYRSRGYFLAQAYLPEQTIRNGVVEITIIEGRWGIIELDKKPATRISTKLLAGILGAHLHEGGVITETGLERPLLLINDLPDASVTTELRPSDTVGAANLRVNVEPGAGPISGYVDADNQGNRFTGEYRYGINVNWNQPLEWGERRVGLAHRQRLGDLELEQARRQPGLLQRRGDDARQVRIVELTRREVDRHLQAVLGPDEGRPAAGFAQHPFADPQDQAGLLGELDEVAGQDQAALRMLPAQQRLVARGFPRLAAGGVDEALVVDPQLALR
jgi:hemolysin activation/secretion protein